VSNKNQNNDDINDAIEFLESELEKETKWAEYYFQKWIKSEEEKNNLVFNYFFTGYWTGIIISVIMFYLAIASH